MNNQNLLPGGVQGHRGGGGRPPDWLKQMCQEIVDKRNLILFLAEVAEGKEVDVWIKTNSDGTFSKLSKIADTKDRIKATEILLERGWGKAAQTIEAGDSFQKVLEAIQGKYA